MKRLRIFFATILLLLFFPLWRWLDYQVLIFPFPLIFTVSFLSVFFVTVLIPVRLLLPETKRLHLLGVFLLIGVFAWAGSTLSNKEDPDHELRHCGLSTFSGLVYPVRRLLPPAHQDDLEVRNQMCWIRKMIKRAPEEISEVRELQDYLELIRLKLLGPPRKYKAALPLIALLHGNLSTSLAGNAFESVEVGKMFLDSLHFWKSQYTTEISEIAYPWYAYPHAWFIKFEYGLIEKNWEAIVDGIRIEEN